MSSIHTQQRLSINDSDIEGVKSIPLSLISFMNSQSPQDNGRSPLFPSPLFNSTFQQFYASILQQQLLLAAQQQNVPSSTREGSSPSQSDRGIDSPMDNHCKKVEIDGDGSANCPLCNERLSIDSEWKEHIDMERQRLLSFISNIKNTNTDNECIPREPRRSLELTRIRTNLNRRRALKTIVPVCDMRSSIDDSKWSSTCVSSSSPHTISSPLTCFSCQRSMEYGIVCSPSEGPRCQECFDVLRTIRKSTPPASSDCGSSSKSDDCLPPNEKRVKVE